MTTLREEIIAGLEETKVKLEELRLKTEELEDSQNKCWDSLLEKIEEEEVGNELSL